MIFISKQLKFKKDKAIKKKDYVKKDMSDKEKENKKSEYIFDKKTNLVPDKNNRLVIIMLSEDKGAVFLLRKFNEHNSTFRYNKGKYIIDNEAIHVTRNGSRVSVYFEGISLPLKTKYIEKIVKKVKYKDFDGTEKESEIQVIKGLRFDSKIFDMVSNREFAEVFTKQPKKTFEYLLLILSIISLVVLCVNAGLIYYFR